MLSRFSNPLWMQEDGGHEQSPPMGMQPVNGQEAGLHDNQHLLAMAPSGGGNFLAPTMVDEDWYFDESAGAGAGAGAGGHGSMLMATGPLGASGSASSSQFFPFINMGGTGSLGVSGFDLGISGGGGGDFTEYLGGGNTSNSGPVSLCSPGNAALLSSFGGFGTSPAQMGELGSLARFGMFDTGAATRNSSSSAAPVTAPFSGRGTPAVLRPLEICPPVGAQPNLFQKRALRRNAGEEEQDMKRKVATAVSGLSAGGDAILDDADEDVVSIDASGLNYDSEEGRGVEESGQKDGKESNANNTVTGGGAADGKGKKKGMPAKNLMAERRRRKKLNDRLYMLRSVVPKISKMDRASILGDAIEYLKELLQKINDLQNELESSPSTSSLPPTPTSFHPLTPTLPTLPPYVKEELYPSALPSPTSQQPRVEVRLREGQAINIHMFCARRPGILLSAMKAMEGIGLDVQQAVISCFNGFALDVFKAEQCKDRPGLLPDQIKAVLLQSAGFQPMI